MESDVSLGTLLSGGIDSSLVSAAAQAALNVSFKTFNVRFSEKQYDATWAAVKVAKHIRSHHQTLHINDGQGTRNYVQVCWSMLANLLPIRRLWPAKRVCGTEFYRPHGRSM